MRRGVGANFSQSRVRGSAQTAPTNVANTAVAPPNGDTQRAHSAHIRTNIARLFQDLRTAMRITPQQAATYLQTSVETIAALESGQFEYLPPWPEIARVITAYAAMAGIDGQPVIAAIGDVLRQEAQAYAIAQPHQPPAPVNARHHGAHHLPVDRLLQAGSALANGAKRLPADAMKQVRERPERAFYAVSLPLGIVLLLLNTSALQAAFDHVPRPVSRMAQVVRQYFQEQFAPVREGLRWIEVDDPRRRRGDKLRRTSQSD